MFPTNKETTPTEVRAATPATTNGNNIIAIFEETYDICGLSDTSHRECLKILKVLFFFYRKTRGLKADNHTTAKDKGQGHRRGEEAKQQTGIKYGIIKII